MALEVDHTRIYHRMCFEYNLNFVVERASTIKVGNFINSIWSCNCVKIKWVSLAITRKPGHFRCKLFTKKAFSCNNLCWICLSKPIQAINGTRNEHWGVFSWQKIFTRFFIIIVCSAISFWPICALMVQKTCNENY